MKKLLFLILILIACTKTVQNKVDPVYCWQCNTIIASEKRDIPARVTDFDTVTVSIVKCNMTEYESKIYAGHASITTSGLYGHIYVTSQRKCTCIRQ